MANTTKTNENRIVWLSTYDNPWNPVTNLMEWMMYDSKLGLSTSCYLARMIDLYCVNNYDKHSDAFTDDELDRITEIVIDDIVQNNPTQRYVKIVSE